MTKRRNPVGTCNLCGCLLELSREHVIPSAAGNTGPYKSVHTLETVVKRYESGASYPGGLVRRVLCNHCNSEAGARYAPKLVEFVQQVKSCVARQSQSYAPLITAEYEPLAVAKCMALMAVTMNPSHWIGHPVLMELRRFVMDHNAHLAPGSVRLLLAIHKGPPLFEGHQYPFLPDAPPLAAFWAAVGVEPLGYMVCDDVPEAANAVSWGGYFDVTRFSQTSWGQRERATFRLKVESTAYPHAGSRE